MLSDSPSNAPVPSTAPVARERRASDQKHARSARRGFVPGYSSVLISTSLKERLQKFRKAAGLDRGGHFERCLISAALDLVLSNEDLHREWLYVRLAEATSQDSRLAVTASLGKQS